MLDECLMKRTESYSNSNVLMSGVKIKYLVIRVGILCNHNYLDGNNGNYSNDDDDNDEDDFSLTNQI